MNANLNTMTRSRNILQILLAGVFLFSIDFLKADELSDAIDAAERSIMRKYISILAVERERKALVAIVNDSSLTENQKVVTIRWKFLAEKPPESEKIIQLKKKAEQGDAAAQYDLGIRYESADEVPKDNKEAEKWIRKAAEQGYAAAQFNLGKRYNYGDGVPKNKDEAKMWIKKAADQGYIKARIWLEINGTF